MAEDDIIALSRFRAALSRARGSHRVEELLADPLAPTLVPTLPVLDLFYLIKEVGLEESQELVAMSSPEQIQGYIDLDAWKGEVIDTDRVWDWLAVVGEAGFERLHHVMDRIDPELVAVVLGREVVVHDITLEEAPENLEHPAWETPDRFFLVEILSEGERGGRILRMLENLYRANLGYARNLLMAVRWETVSMLEEDALRLHTGRLMDLGFADPLEALAIYQPLDPATVKLGEGTAEPLDPALEPIAAGPSTLPTPYVEPLRRGGFFSDVLATLTDERELTRLFQAVVLLSNHVLAADRVPPGEVDAVASGIERTLSTLSLGLETVAAGDRGAPARQALATISLRRLFRVGASLAWQLRILALALVKSGRMGRRPRSADLLDPPLDQVFAGLGERRPAYAKALDQEPGAPPVTGTRPFKSVADIRRVAAAIAEAQLQAELAAVIGLPDFQGGYAPSAGAAGPSLPHGDVGFASVLGTAAARVLLGEKPGTRPLRADEFARLRETGLDPAGRLREGAIATVEAAFTAALAGRPITASLRALVQDRLRALELEVGRLPAAEPPDPRYVHSLLLDSLGQTQ